MDLQQEISGIPRALRAIWKEDQPGYRALVRNASWTTEAIYILANYASYPAALAGAYFFESLLGRPVVVRSPVAFNAYSAPALPARSLVIAISGSTEDGEIQEAIRRARKQGASIWNLSHEPASEFGGTADGRVLLRSGEAPAEGIQYTFLQHATLLAIALLAARTLRKPSPELNSCEKDFEELPDHLERIESQMTDASRTLAGQLKSLPSVVVAGAGFYYPAALQISHYLNRFAGMESMAADLAESRCLPPVALREGSGILIVSGSRARLKSCTHEAAHQAKVADAKVFAITDSNDRQLSERAEMALLLPISGEGTGSLMAIALIALSLPYISRRTALEQPAKPDTGSSAQIIL